MPHPIVHAEIRSTDPDATRKFFADLLGWTYPDPGAVPGYTFVDTGVPGALYTAISPLQGGSDLVTFFIAVDDIESAVKRAGELGGQVVQEPQHVLSGEAHPSVLDERLAHDDGTLRDVGGDHPEPLCLRAKRHGTAAEEGVQEGQVGPEAPRDHAVDLPEDQRAQPTLPSEVGIEGRPHG